MNNNHYPMLYSTMLKLQWAIACVESKEKFGDAFGLARNCLGRPDNDLAKVFQVSRPTIERWSSYQTAPHPIGRKQVLEYMLGRIEESIRLYVEENKILDLRLN